MRRPRPTRGLSRQEKKKYYITDLKIYVGGRVAYGRVFQTGQVKNEFTEKQKNL
jgi:hypothetical protein